MGGGLGKQRQLVTGFLADADTGLTAQIHKPLQSIILALTSNQNVVKAPASGFERLLDRMNPVQNFHDG
jgi:hypothetical protein